MEINRDTPMYYSKDLLILERPIATPLGSIYFPKVYEYLEICMLAEVLTFNRTEMEIILEQMVAENPNATVYQELLNDMDLVQFIQMFSSEELEGSDFHKLYQNFKLLFMFFFKEDVFDELKSEEELESYLEIMRDVSCVTYKRPSSDPLVRRFDKARDKLKEIRGESVTFSSMITSVQVATGQDPVDMTIYRLYEIFDRVSVFKEHDLTTLYSTLSGDVKVTAWYKDTSKVQKEESFITDEQLQKAKDNKGLSTNL